MSHDTLAKE